MSGRRMISGIAAKQHASPVRIADIRGSPGRPGSKTPMEMAKIALVVMMTISVQHLWRTTWTLPGPGRWLGLVKAVTAPAGEINWAIQPTVHYNSSLTTDLAWTPTGLPSHPELNTTNPWSAKRTADGPYGNRHGKAHDFGDFGKEALETFWDKWVGPVYYPPLTGFPTPPRPYPIPDVPPIYPSYYLKPTADILPDLAFPSDFLFGWATAAQQYEGAVKVDGKGPTTWDYAARYDGFTADGTTSDVGPLGYYLYKQDIARLAALGGNAYAFTAFWTRILPFGMKDTPVNEAGLSYYEDLVAYCHSLHVKPIMTLFHWDTPLAIQLEYGGFGSPKAIDDFVHYAEVMFRRLNGTIDTWFTFNEPGVFCGGLQYPLNYTMPVEVQPEQYKYVCARHVILAHAKAYRLFNDLNIQGQISFKNDDFLGIPWREGNKGDEEAAERHAMFSIGFWSEPIYRTGDWPEVVKQTLPADLLPEFSEQEKALIKGTADFVAIDAYRENWITVPEGGIAACQQNRSHPAWPECTSQREYDASPYGWGIGDFSPKLGWLHGSWQYMRPLLRRLNERYPTPGGIYLTEFGFSEPYEDLRHHIHEATQDTTRTSVIITYLAEMLKGVAEDGIPIKGVFAWCLTDNWEWNQGFSARFGVQHVDWHHPTLKRTFKRSAIEMSKFWKSHRT